MLVKKTQEYAYHGMSLECDIYASDDFQDTPVFLYFHPGGLVAWGRDVVPPWLVQVCFQRKWPLISVGYRLLPQTGSKGLLEDVTAAFEFAQNWDAAPGRSRKVIAGGGSGGFAAAALTGHYLNPLALFSISGINTFRHKFFNSSTMLLPEPLVEADVAKVIALPMAVGATNKGSPPIFTTDKLQADGSKNPDYKATTQEPEEQTGLKYSRDVLYDYYTYKNGWIDLIGDIDPGYEWAKDPANEAHVKKWPPTVIFHGNDDPDVEFDVSDAMRKLLGDDKVKLSVAEGMDHLFESQYFIEDDKPGMDAVREAVANLDKIVSGV